MFSMYAVWSFWCFEFRSSLQFNGLWNEDLKRKILFAKLPPCLYTSCCLIEIFLFCILEYVRKIYNSNSFHKENLCMSNYRGSALHRILHVFFSEVLKVSALHSIHFHSIVFATVKSFVRKRTSSIVSHTNNENLS